MTEARVPVTDDAREQYPQIRKVGRYGFYAVCAFGVSLLCYAGAKALGFHSDITRIAANAAMIVSFFALRDIEKNAAIRQMGEG